jgi:cell division protein FtsQ
MGDEREMTETVDDRSERMMLPDPGPRVEREVEPETLVSTVEHQLTVIPEPGTGPEPQDDGEVHRSEDGEHGEIEGEGGGEGAVSGDPAVAGPEVVTHAEAATLLTLDVPGRHRTHGRLKTWVVVAAAVAALAIVAFASTYTPLFAADTVRVEGAGHLSVAQVRRIARIQPGVNVFRLDARRAERRLERNVWIADALVTTTLPSSVSIEIWEREPAAVVVTAASGERAIVAGDGTILAPATDAATLPLVEGADGVAVPSEGQRALGAEVAAALPPELVPRVEALQAGTDGTVTVMLSGGVAVSYGDADALAQKGQALLAVLRWADRSGVHLGSVDVRTPGAPTARLAGAVSVVRGPDLPAPATPISGDDGASPTA